MAYAADFMSGTWTAADLVARFGPIPLHRLRHEPPPGLATEADLLRVNERKEGLCELIDGTLVEKVLGNYESELAAEIVYLLKAYIRQSKLGVVRGSDGLCRTEPAQVRSPDVSFTSRERLERQPYPPPPIASVCPDLAVEVISRGNTREEMERKLREYFAAGVRLVWYVYPLQKEVHVYTAADQPRILSQDETLTGGEVLPGFSADLNELFAKPY